MLILLESETRFSMVELKAQANKNGTLIPFLNGVLNSKTKILHKHHPSLYCTHIIDENDNSDKSIENTPFSEFLGQFTGFRPILLNLLRAFLNIVFTNNTKYQVALYIYGPGGTGKSTLIQMLLHLLGPEASISSSLEQLNSRFGLSRISHKIFLVLNDMSHFKGKEPQRLKEVIAGDSVESEKKYKEATNIIPQVIVTITGNSIRELINPTGGINRRIIYFPADYIPLKKDIHLFHLNSLGVAEGKLIPYLPGFIN